MRWFCRINSSFCLNGFYDLRGVTQPKAVVASSRLPRDVPQRAGKLSLEKVCLSGNIAQKMFLARTDQGWTGFFKNPIGTIEPLNSQHLAPGSLISVSLEPNTELGTRQLVHR